MTFFVYKNESREGRKAHTGQPPAWRLVGTFEQEHRAVVAAERLCPRGAEIRTDPANGLRKSLFSSTKRDFTCAMITTKPL